MLDLFYHDNVVRATKENNEIWFVAKDVCESLDISNYRDASTKLTDRQKKVIQMETTGGVQKVIVVNEAGVYKLAFQSRKEEAERFTNWVTDEVLPSIRQSGAYSLKEKDSEQIAYIANGINKIANEMQQMEKAQHAALSKLGKSIAEFNRTVEHNQDRKREISWILQSMMGDVKMITGLEKE